MENQQIKQTIQPIATTEKIERRLFPLELNGIKLKHFKPDTIELFRLNNKINVKGKTVYNHIKGCKRIIDEDDIDYQSRQISWLKKIRTNNFSKEIRYLTFLPEDYQDYNELRNSFMNIQRSAKILKPSIFTEKTEKSNVIKEYINGLNDKNLRLVIDVAMLYPEFVDLVNFGLKNVEEIVLLYRDWLQEIQKYLFLLTLPQEEKNKIHIARIPLYINQYKKDDLIANIFICEGFKSISFQEPEIHPAIIQHMKNKPRKIKTQEEKEKLGLWVDTDIMEYVYNHPEKCNCLENNSVTGLGVDSCIIHHDMECLSREYKKIRSNEEERKKLLQLQTMQPLVRKLGIKV